MPRLWNRSLHGIQKALELPMNKAPSLEVELRELEERLLAPQLRRSNEALSDMLAESFLEFSSSGRRYDKQQVIAVLASESAAQWSLSEFKVVSLAADVALTTYTAARHTGDEQAPVRSLRSSVWQRINGRWRIAFHQGTLAEGARVL
jgi:hypothetical protein